MTVKLSDVAELINREVVQEVKDFIPECAKLTKMVPSLTPDGRELNIPVQLKAEAGVTFGDDTAYAYNDPVIGDWQEIKVNSLPFTLQSRITKTAFNQLTSEKAIKTQMGPKMLGIKKAASKYLEISALYGRDAKATSKTGATTGTASSGSIVIKFDNRAFSTGMLAALVGNKINFFKVADDLQTQGDFILVDVDGEAFTATFQEVTGGDAAALATYVNGTGAVELYIKGSKAKEMIGLVSQITASTGEMFGINKSEPLWRGNSHDLGGEITMAKILKGVAKAVERGFDGDAVVMVSPKAWEKLNSDEASLRVYDSSYKPEKAERGSEGICFHGQAGKLRIISHLFLKDGDAIMVPERRCLKRVGPKELSFTSDSSQDGKSDGSVLRQLEGNAGYQILCEAQWVLLVSQPQHCVYFTNAVAAV